MDGATETTAATGGITSESKEKAIMTTYNGWHNYTTWLVALWLDNDQGTYSYMTELAETALEDGDKPWQLGETIKEFVQDLCYPDENSCTGLVADLLNASLSNVDWTEVAEHYLTAARENAEES
jgi:hypothetical protein